MEKLITDRKARMKLSRKIKTNIALALFGTINGMVAIGWIIDELIRIYPTQTFEQNIISFSIFSVIVFLACVLNISLYKAAIRGGGLVGILEMYDDMMYEMIKYLHDLTPEEMMKLKQQVDDEWRKHEDENKRS
jgi:hypothetical protein